MTAILTPDERGRFSWGNGVVTMTFAASADSPVRMVDLRGRGMTGPDAASAGIASGDASDAVGQRDPRPIVEVCATATGANDNRLTIIDTVVGTKLRFVSATADGPGSTGGVHRLRIVQYADYDALRPGGRPMESVDPASARDAAAPVSTASGNPVRFANPADPADGLTVESVFEAYPGVSAVRAYTRLRSPRPFPVEAVSSLSLTLPMDVHGADVDSSAILWGDAAWAVENDWHRAALRDTAVRDRNQVINPGESSSSFALTSTSTWSTGVHEPAGIVEACAPADGDPGEPGDPATSHAAAPAPRFSIMWQIEHNGPWHWEVGENDPGLHVTAFGPEYRDHHWYTALGGGRDFTSVPVSFAITAGDWQQAVADMTLHRRALRRAKARELGRTAQFERTQGLVVYNDYMNTLFGDPRLDKELPLIGGAAKAGADVFCIDAGWYDSTDGGWWDMVGEWAPSTNRFGDAGLAGVARAVRDAGMGLGLWLEPEVIGVKSPLAAALPDDAFITRHGVRVCDSGRYLLDFRSPAAREHVTRTVDRLIADFDVVFFKFDYNTITGVGTDRDAESVGGGLLDHCRAYLDWLDDLRRRHPGVMIENCGSGAMRADYAQLSRLDLQSTSDQCDPLIYAAIAAGAGLTILPEQQGNWGYAQQEMDDETAVLTLASGVLGRLYLSGFIDRMDDARLALVRDAIALHRRVLAEQETLVPWWPAGLPDFNGDWLVAGLRPHTVAGCAGCGRGDAGDDGCGCGSSPVDAVGRDRSAGLVDSVDSAGSADAVSYVTVWRRAGADTIDLPLPEGRSMTQIFPDPSVPDHAPDAGVWSVDRVDDATVRLTVADASKPSARIFAVR
ncbi:glycoside hydrolase family 36 protein [Bifidobacterium samirii]|uniref:Alpha-galactosidase n=1 Tax=Bifidobacterium samirii TaxID=2306974 RepID=A0A430FWE6_9BIFI|nr:glycoside hydrolase family 36 protein [Bifidobacterium samirii]RSX58508.1 alpha-galactosidase [Bifidobacterium samirii]